MEDLYTFGKKKYVPAEPIDKSMCKTVKNLFWVSAVGVKCFFLGIFIILKTILFFCIPLRTKDIQNKVALITGGANGIGRAIGLELAKRGCNIAVVDVDVEGAMDTVEEIQLFGVKAFFYEADVANYDEVYALKGKILADLGPVDILINNAGLLAKVSLLQGSTDDILRIFKVNLISQYWTLRVFLPDMIARKSGHVVAIASIMAMESSGRAISYSTTKYGIRGLMDGLYDLIQMDDLKINVTTIFPALVNTRKEFIDQFISNDGLNPIAELSFYTPEEIGKATVEGILKNKKYVIIPWFNSMINIINLLPEQFQDLIRDNFKPKVRPEVNEPKSILVDSLHEVNEPELKSADSSYIN